MTEPTPARIPVPNLITDPVWSLEPCGLAISVAGREFEIPALPAATWLAALMSEDFDDAVFPGLVEDEEDARIHIANALFDEVLDPDDLDAIVFEIIDQISGRPWWVTMRLVIVARDNWPVLGAEMLQAVDANRLSLSAWLDVFLVTTLRQLDEKDVAMFTSWLQLPPQGFESEEHEPEMSASAFLALAGG